MFRLEQVSKAFRGTPALDGISLEVAPRSTTVLIGPSGCGKSTLLRLLIGLLQPDAGTVSFDGVALGAATLPAVRRRLGYVIQQGGLFPHLTAQRNITLMADYLGWQPGRIATRLGELAGLTHFPADALERYPGELSGGQNQRVALMRALFLDPDVLLLDEPLGALDPMIRHELQQDLREVFATLDKTVVMVTHDLAEAACFGDVIVLMRDGRIVQRGTLTEMSATPADEFVGRFIRAQRDHLGGAGPAT
jgi:osmoprotectant transport system ATP-binding protein